MIILEGPDLAGKTTFAKQLLSDLPGQYTYQHWGLLRDDFDFCWGYMERTWRHSVVDRLHMSEYVYRTALGETPRCDPEKYRLVDAHCRHLGAVTVVITVEETILEERWQAQPNHEHFSIENIFEVNRIYSEICAQTDCTMDWDIHIHCDKNTEFPDEHNLAHIFDLYGVRQDAVSSQVGQIL